jgi:3(or 17)beta-hydroxysteroid dehydrogenase
METPSTSFRRPLEERAALVAGAVSGLGEAISLSFAREGARVLLADMADEVGHRLVYEIEGAGGTAAFVHTDVRHEAHVIRAVSHVVERWGALDVLVNNRRHRQEHR